ncbi:hypothetical protein DM02DRAFT_618387 [Periconia macrospinosa]|uniref:F-box domain-containing protein n=1 Tax=Periconia macrospinosa TaxID=97972 RepID=A0A2V1DC41_9PLEO|nr:hypothetical protein DM02DRAFT_618387 [Periconia macrospinosa]
MSLPTLPNELKNYVFADLTLGDMLSLAETCKDLYLVCQPAIFRAVSIGRGQHERRWGQYTGWKHLTIADPISIVRTRSLRSFLRTLIAKPELAELVHNVDIYDACKDWAYCQEGPGDGVQINDDDHEAFAGAIDALCVSGAEQWKEAVAGNWSTLPKRPWTLDTLGEHQFEAMVTLLLYTCPQIRELSIRLDVLGWNPWLMNLFHEAADSSGSSSGYKVLGQLSRVTIRFVDFTLAAHGEEAPLIHSLLHTLYQLPLLRSLTVGPDNHSAREVDRVYWGVQLGSIPDLESLPVAEQLSTLRLRKSKFSSSDLQTILQSSPDLHTLEFESIRNTKDGVTALDVGHVKSILDSRRETLMHLILRHHRDSGDDDQPEYDPPFLGHLGPLQDFTSLVSLEVSLGALFGLHNAWWHGPEYPDLGSFLPPNLQILTITTDAAGSPALRKAVGIPTIAIFRKFFAGEIANPNANVTHNTWRYIQGWHQVHEPVWKKATPKIKEFVFRIDQQGASTVYWKAMAAKNELLSMVEEQGIYCSIFVDGTLYNTGDFSPLHVPHAYDFVSPVYDVGFPPPPNHMSPQYLPVSLQYSPTSPGYSPTSPQYSPTSPGYSPHSPEYSPHSPPYPMTYPMTSPQYSPTSPRSPQDPAMSPVHSPTSPSSPPYSLTFPVNPPTSPRSPPYSAPSPAYSSTSPDFPHYSVTYPVYSPASPVPEAS